MKNHMPKPASLLLLQGFLAMKPIGSAQEGGKAAAKAAEAAPVEEKLRFLMVGDHVPAGAELY